MILDTPVSEIMRRHVLTIRKDFSFSEACRLFFRMGIHHLPVVDENNHLLGMLSSHDALRAFALRGHLLKDWNEENVDWSFPVEELMTVSPITARESDKMGDVIHVCTEHHIQSLPIVENERLIGMITSHDVMQFLARSVSSGQPV